MFVHCFHCPGSMRSPVPNGCLAGPFDAPLCTLPRLRSEWLVCRAPVLRYDEGLDWLEPAVIARLRASEAERPRASVGVLAERTTGCVAAFMAKPSGPGAAASMSRSYVGCRDIVTLRGRVAPVLAGRICLASALALAGEKGLAGTAVDAPELHVPSRFVPTGAVFEANLSPIRPGAFFAGAEVAKRPRCGLPPSPAQARRPAPPTLPGLPDMADWRRDVPGDGGDVVWKLIGPAPWKEAAFSRLCAAIVCAAGASCCLAMAWAKVAERRYTGDGPVFDFIALVAAGGL
mmetsp:Transcript_127771/g.367800  ORF Transcript_127771/g.367800 Transcript_127771/m.367800 type:complete len:289 (+) Transcript_127771:1319-2185(+)